MKLYSWSKNTIMTHDDDKKWIFDQFDCLLIEDIYDLDYVIKWELSHFMFQSL